MQDSTFKPPDLNGLGNASLPLGVDNLAEYITVVEREAAPLATPGENFYLGEVSFPRNNWMWSCGHSR